MKSPTTPLRLEHSVAPRAPANLLYKNHSLISSGANHGAYPHPTLYATAFGTRDSPPESSHTGSAESFGWFRKDLFFSDIKMKAVICMLIWGSEKKIHHGESAKSQVEGFHQKGMANHTFTKS